MSPEDIIFNPAVTYNMLYTRYLYAIGNSPAKDLTEGCQIPSEIRFLLLGCGDPRNILYTVGELSRLEKPPKYLEFNINDVDDVCLARAVILLTVLNTLSPRSQEDVDFLWSVWYDLHLSRQHRERLNEIMKNFLSNPDECIMFSDSKTKESIGRIMESWFNLSLPVADVRKKRENFLQKKFNADFDTAVKQLVLRKRPCINVPGGISKNVLDTWLKEVRNYMKHGSCVVDGEDTVQLDARLTLNPSHYCTLNKCWRMHHSSEPFSSYNVILFDEQKGLTENCKDQLKALVSGWCFLKQQAKMKFIIWPGDGLTLCTRRLPVEKTFDFIDTSNLCDSLGLLNVLVGCSSRLKRNGVLLTQSFHLYRNHDTPADFLREELHISENFFPTLLGLRHADSFEIGKEHLRRLSSIHENEAVDLRWVKCDHDCDKINLRDSPQLLEAYCSLASNCLYTYQPIKKICKNPLTLILLIKRLAKRFEGGGYI